MSINIQSKINDNDQKIAIISANPDKYHIPTITKNFETKLNAKDLEIMNINLKYESKCIEFDELKLMFNNDKIIIDEHKTKIKNIQIEYDQLVLNHYNLHLILNTSTLQHTNIVNQKNDIIHKLEYINDEIIRTNTILENIINKQNIDNNTITRNNITTQEIIIDNEQLVHINNIQYANTINLLNNINDHEDLINEFKLQIIRLENTIDANNIAIVDANRSWCEKIHHKIINTIKSYFNCIKSPCKFIKTYFDTTFVSKSLTGMILRLIINNFVPILIKSKFTSVFNWILK